MMFVHAIGTASQAVGTANAMEMSGASAGKECPGSAAYREALLFRDLHSDQIGKNVVEF